MPRAMPDSHAPPAIEFKDQGSDVWPWFSLLLVASLLYLVIALVVERVGRRRRRRSYDSAVLNWRLRADDYESLLPPPPRRLRLSF